MPPKIPSQAICYIDVGSVPQQRWNDDPMKKCEELIRRIIELYNIEQDRSLAFQEGSANKDSHFSSLWFHRKIVTMPPLVQSLSPGSEDLSDIRVDVIPFYFRVQGSALEIFALVNTKSRDIVLPYTDHSFSCRIAKRLLARKVTSLKALELVGNVRQHSLEYKEGKVFTAEESFTKYVHEWSSNIRETSSLYGLKPFQTKTGKPSPYVTKVWIEREFVTVQKELLLTDYSGILNHFSKIYRNEATYQILAHSTTGLAEQGSLREKTKRQTFRFWP